MAIIDVDRMYWEMLNTMQSNFRGNAQERYEQAKALFLESVAETIDANAKDLVDEVAQIVED